MTQKETQSDSRADSTRSDSAESCGALLPVFGLGMFDFLSKPALRSDKPAQGPYQRAVIVGDRTITMCIENDLGGFKSVLHMLFDGTKCLAEAFFSKGEPFDFDNWSVIDDQSQCPVLLSSHTIEGTADLAPLSGIKVSCCEVVFAMKAMLTYAGIQRTLDSSDQSLVADVVARIWEEGKYSDLDPSAVGHKAYLQYVAESELRKMSAAIESGNAERMKKAGREFSGVFTFPPKQGQRDLRYRGLPWYKIACALLYHLKLRLWLQRPAMRSLLTHVFRDAKVREVSHTDALYAVLTPDPKISGASPVDAWAAGAPAAAAPAIDDDWQDLDEGKGNLLGKVCQAAIAALSAGALDPDFAVDSAALRALGFGPVLLTEEAFRAAAVASAAGAGRPPGPADDAHACLAGLLRGLGVREISPHNLTAAGRS